MATRIRTWLAPTTTVRVVDLCAGYGLLAQVLLLLDADLRSTALAVDIRLPKNHALVHGAVIAAIGITGATTRLTRDRVPSVESDVITAANQISAAIGS